MSGSAPRKFRNSAIASTEPPFDRRVARKCSPFFGWMKTVGGLA